MNIGDKDLGMQKQQFFTGRLKKPVLENHSSKSEVWNQLRRKEFKQI